MTVALAPGVTPAGRASRIHDPAPGARVPPDPVRSAAPVSLEVVGSLLRGLNREQRAAVTHGDGRLLVIAGPGTGKTEVITRRVAWLIATKRARPSEILALTFTEKAAAEMQARVDVLVPYGQADAAIHTFHAFGDRLLREFAFELGLPPDARVLSRAECVAFLAEHLFQLGLDRYRPLGDPRRFLAALVALFQRAKDEDISPADHHAFAQRLAAEAAGAIGPAGDPGSSSEALREQASRHTELARAYERYQHLMAAAGCVDFGDQVALATRVLRDHPAARADVTARYRYLLVDEFQDTSRGQAALVELLAGDGGNVTAVGDDDQSIYTFRGAALSNIMGFAGRGSGVRQIVLRRSYRSRRAILDAAQRLIRHNDPHRLEVRNRLDKRLVAHRRGVGVPVRLLSFRNEEEEADGVATAIADRIRDGASPRDVAILVRTNGDAEPFLRSLNVAGVPWRFSGASGLYARPEVRALLAFMRAVADPESTVDMYAVATADPYRIGGTDLTAMLQLVRRRHRSLWSVLEELDVQAGVLRVSPSTRQSVHRLVTDLRAAIALSHERPAGDVLYAHLKRSGVLERLVSDATTHGEEALRDVARLFEIVRAQSRVLPDARVAFVARHLQALVESGDDPDSRRDDADDAEAVSVLTVHKAKGLEFPAVYLVGLTDGRFPARERPDPLPFPATPGSSDAPEEAAAAEERRLFYVAMTRARDELILTFPQQAPDGRRRRPSRFLAEALDLGSSPAADASVSVAGGRSFAERATVDELSEHERAPAPRRRTAERLALSFSQLDTYLACPLKYKLRYVVGIPTPPHHALVYGNALHQAVAAFHVSRMRAQPLTEAALLDVFAAHWSSEGFVSRDHEEARYAAGQSALRRFRERELASEGTAPASVEREFSFTLDGDRIRGRYDRVDVGPDGVVVTDYKSGDERDSGRADQKARESLQLSIYALAHEAETGTPPVAVQLHFLDSGVVGRASVDSARLERARVRIRRAADGIRDGDLRAKPGYVTCGYCPYREVCPSSAA